MPPGSALLQADLDYKRADVDQKIQQYIATSQGHSAEQDKAFVMAIEIGSSILGSSSNRHARTAGNPIGGGSRAGDDQVARKGAKGLGRTPEEQFGKER